MANSINNVVTHNLSGKIGDLLVFSRRNGKTIVGKAPVRKGNFLPTTVTLKFNQAVLYARVAVANPDTKKAYKKIAKRGQSAFNVALEDYFNAPVMLDMDLAAYTGAVGSIIKVPITDGFMVKSVKFTISKPDGTLLEQGNATKDVDGVHYVYTATQANPVLTGSKISIEASDLPGNVSKQEKVLP